MDRLIQYAAQNCSLTIIGKNTDTLSQLMRRHPVDRVMDALNHFALYQLEEKEDRRFPIGRTFGAFIRKFDLFADAESVDRRLADERRWFREHVEPPDQKGLPVSRVSNEPEQNPEENPEERQQRRIQMRDSLENQRNQKIKGTAYKMEESTGRRNERGTAWKMERGTAWKMPGRWAAWKMEEST